MLGNADAGPKFDHANKTLMVVLGIFFAAFAIVYIAVMVWGYLHHGVSAALIFPFFIGVIPIIVMGATPRWQLGPEGLLDLRKWKRKQLIARYSEIRSIRTLKTRGKSTRFFEIVTSAGAQKVDVLQGDAFLDALMLRIPADRMLAD